MITFESVTKKYAGGAIAVDDHRRTTRLTDGGAEGAVAIDREGLGARLEADERVRAEVRNPDDVAVVDVDA